MFCEDEHGSDKYTTIRQKAMQGPMGQLNKEPQTDSGVGGSFGRSCHEAARSGHELHNDARNGARG